MTRRWTEAGRRGGEVGAGAAGGRRAVSGVRSGGVTARVAGAYLRLGEDGLEAAAAAAARAACRRW